MGVRFMEKKKNIKLLKERGKGVIYVKKNRFGFGKFNY